MTGTGQHLRHPSVTMIANVQPGALERHVGHEDTSMGEAVLEMKEETPTTE